ncbi:hypothetical protein PMZ80_009361 [Knufia obscura]|uniref:Uncharacterized protein n=2 Tax=Knufia TaxID=430999 RepID=A0AAN8IAP1_9EURO|nr:hypothetical protein PMZ80_009361 [Knufia obscura]KAK5955820.1 hypothetical protein OHC33_003461 [Knufia fluminis]
MAEDERDRVGFFRQRWAQENFEPRGTSPPRNNNGNLDGDVELSEVNARRPAQPEGRLKKAQKRSWMENPRSRSSSNRLAPLTAPPPTSDASTSLRSPVDSHNNTIYSDRDQNGELGKPNTPDEQVEDSRPPKWLEELYILSWLTFFSLLGTLARLGVEAITQYPDAPVTSRVLWANLGGSFFMGFLVEDRNLFGLPTNLRPPTPKEEDQPADETKLSSTHLKFKKTIPLYIGLTTGFCGSFTSFSSFIRDAFLALTNALPAPSPTTPYHSSIAPSPRNGGFSFLALLAILIIHPAISLAVLKTGAHFALLLRPILPQTILPAKLFIKIVNPLMVFIGLTSWLLGALFLTIFTPHSGPSPVNWRARATIPLLLAPPGCILRYYLSKHLNRPSSPNFPIGTFAANIFGTLILGMAWDLQHARSIGGSSGNACAVLLGVQEGFCGCLTTVSTWVVELNGLGKRAGWVYGGVSVGVGVAGMVIVMGGMGWTVGFVEPVCG